MSFRPEKYFAGESEKLGEDLKGLDGRHLTDAIQRSHSLIPVSPPAERVNFISRRENKNTLPPSTSERTVSRIELCALDAIMNL
jgi:hypothetical protein